MVGVCGRLGFTVNLSLQCPVAFVVFRFVFAAVLLLAVLVGSLKGDAAFEQQRERFVAFGDWKPIEKQLLDDLSDGRLDSRSLLEAALIVGGHEAPRIAALQNAFAASCQRCRAQNPRLEHEPYPTRISQLFTYLLDHHLYGEYTPDLCDVGATLTRGEFNCLTATILFRALCHEFDIPVQAAWEPSHVRCWIPIESDRAGYLVETTADSATAAVSGLYPRSKLTERQLTPEQLLGKVFYNRGVQWLHRDQFASALFSTWASCLLDPNDVPAQNNLRACLNNWALWASQRDRYVFAMELLDAGLQLDPNYEPFSRNRRLLENH